MSNEHFKDFGSHFGWHIGKVQDGSMGSFKTLSFTILGNYSETISLSIFISGLN